jgi:hypothetical protein
MGIKYIHVVLIVASIILSLGFGLWTFNHNYMTSAFCSIAIGIGLIIYCVKFIKKMRTL